MNIAIIGRTHILLETAKLLEKEGHQIKLVVTAREAPEYKASVADFRKFAKQIGAHFIKTQNINKEIAVLTKKNQIFNIEIGLSMNYPNVISQEIIDLFPLGILNAHLGNLPRYRGNATINWAIIAREPKMALCLQYMIGGELDSGDIVARQYKKITLKTKVTEFYDWMEEKMPTMVKETLAKLAKNPKYILEKQSTNPKDILRCYPRIPKDSKIDWKKSNIDILTLINASAEPFSGAYTFYNGQKIIIWDAELFFDEENYLAVPGQIAKINKKEGHLVVICGNGKIKITEIQIDNYRGIPSQRIKSIRKRFE